MQPLFKRLALLALVAVAGPGLAAQPGAVAALALATPVPVPGFQLVSATASPYVFGNYRLIVRAQGNLDDALVVQALKQAEHWSLREVGTEKPIPLPQPQLGTKAGLFMATFNDLDLTSKSRYEVSFKGGDYLEVLLPPVPGMDLDAFETEKGKTGDWVASLHPRVIQVSGTAGTTQPGLDVAVSKVLHDSLSLDLKASLGLVKQDPGNYESLGLSLQPWNYSVSQNGCIGSDFIGLQVQESASQSLDLQDLSGGLRSCLALHPIDGLQPVYVTGGLDAALRHLNPGQNYSDPRTFLEARWGWEGLVGPGSHLLVVWQYWMRMDQWAPASDPSLAPEREYVEIESSLPLWQDKNFKVTYADGALPPAFVPQTSVKAGLEIFWDGKPAFVGRPEAVADGN